MGKVGHYLEGVIKRFILDLKATINHRSQKKRFLACY